MANMNMIIHDMEGQIELGDTFKNPKFHKGNRLQTFDRVVANPMWNQDWWKEADYDADEFDRFPKGAGYPGGQSRLGLGTDHLCQPQAAGSRRRGGRHWRGLARLGQCEHKQRKGSSALVRRAGPHRRRDLFAGETCSTTPPRPASFSYSNKAKPKERQGKLFLLNATNEFTKGDRRTISPTMPSCASPTRSARGTK